MNEAEQTKLKTKSKYRKKNWVKLATSQTYLTIFLAIFLQIRSELIVGVFHYGQSIGKKENFIVINYF